VLVFDSDKPRNAAARALHGYLTRDGTPPRELRAIGRRELVAYPSVEVRDLAVIGAERVPEGGFEITIAAGERERAHVLLLGTGRQDLMPELPGFQEFFGRGVYHCPYCDGWEHRDERIVIYGRDDSAASLALTLLTWSSRLTICADGEPTWNVDNDAAVAAADIAVLRERVARLDGDQRVRRVAFQTREPLECDAVFFCSDCVQRSTLPEKLGCKFDGGGNVLCKGYGATDVPGLFVAGNVRGGVHLAIMAAAEGAEAAVAINDYLADLALAQRAPKSRTR
jgi:thioredoxin reductase